MMSNEWLDVAYINCEEAILHGQIVENDKERKVRVVLTEEQIRQIENANSDHELAMQKLLLSFVVAAS